MINFTIIIGIIFIIATPPLLLCIGSHLNKLSEEYIFICYILVIIINFGVTYLLCSGIKKNTLIDYNSGKISYIVTDIDVENNKVTNIKIINKE